MEETMLTIAKGWLSGRLPDDEARYLLNRLEIPIRHVDEDGVWYEGEEENSLEVVSSKLSYDDFEDFKELLENS